MSRGNFHMLWADMNLPQYELTSSPSTSITEGNSFTITLKTKRIPDGTTVGYTITGVNLSDLSTPGSLTGTFTVSSNTATLSVGTNTNDDIYVMILGKRPVGSGESGYNVHRYLANADLSSPAFLNSLIDVFNSPTNLGMFFKSDGGSLFLQDPGNEQFRRYSFVAAEPDPDQWNLIPSTSNQIQGIPSQIGSYGTTGTNHQGMWISSSGTTLFQVDRDLKRILQDTIPTWNPLGCGSPERSLDISTDATLPSGISVKPDGTKAFVSCLASPAGILEYSGTAFQCNTWTLTDTFLVGTNPSDVFVTEDGTRMYVSDDTAKIHYCTLGTAWDLTTATLVSTWDLSGTFDNISSVYIAEPTSEQFRITLDPLDSLGNRTGSHYKEMTIYEVGYP